MPLLVVYRLETNCSQDLSLNLVVYEGISETTRGTDSTVTAYRGSPGPVWREKEPGQQLESAADCRPACSK